MSSESPVVEIYSSDGYELSAVNNAATPAGTRGILVAGSDGTNTRFILVDGSARQIIVGAGVAGTPTGGVVTIQGVAGGTVVPVSGTVAVTQSTSPWVTNISQFGGTNISTGTGAGGAGIPRVTVSNDSNILATQSGTWTTSVTQATASNLNATVVGTGTDNSTNSTTKVPVLPAVATTVAPTYTNTNMVPLSVDTSGNLRVTGTVTAANASVSTTGTAPPGSATYIGGSVTTAAPTYTTGQMNALSLTTAGALRVDASGVTQPVSGLWQGPTNTTVPVNAAQIGGADSTGKLQVPQVDKILGQTVQQLSVASTITSPKNAAAGYAAFPTPYGTLRVSNEPASLFGDHFIGSSIDTTNNWNVPITSGSGAAATVSDGALTLTASNTANAYTSLSSQPTFSSTGLGFVFWGATIQLEASAITGQEKFWGLGTIPGSPTNTAALTDAIGFEQTTTGALNAVIYAGGTQVYSQNLTRLNDGYFHRYAIVTRSDSTFWYMESLEVPVAAEQYILPFVDVLPINLHVVNGVTPSGAGTFVIETVAIGDTAPDTINITDGQYAWRKSVIKPSYTPATTTDNALVVTISPNVSPTGRLPVTLGDPGTQDVFGEVVTVARLGQIQISFNVEPPSILLNVANTGSATTSQGIGTGIFNTGTTTGSQSTGVSFSSVTYTPHHEVFSAFTCNFTAGVASTYQRIGLYDANNGFSFGYNGITFGIWTRFNGVDTFIAQSTWNVDMLTGTIGSKFTNNGLVTTLITTNINFYRVRFGWLGVAPVIFEVLSPDGNFVIVHNLRIPNTQTTPSIVTPNLPMTVDVNNQATTSNLTLTTVCWVAGTTEPYTPSISGIGTITALGGQVLLPTVGLASLSWNITGNWIGTLMFQFTLDGVNWVNNDVLDYSNGTFTNSTTSNQTFQAGIASYKQYRIYASAWFSGTAIISYSASSQTSIVTSQSLLTDGSNNGPVAVKPSNILASTSDAALVVAVSPNNSVKIANLDHLELLLEKLVDTLTTGDYVYGDLTTGPKALRSTQAVNSTYSASLSPTILLLSNNTRTGAIFVNDSGSNNNLYLLFGAGQDMNPISTQNYSVFLKPGAYYEVPFGFSGRIDGIWDGTSGNVYITEIVNGAV